MPAFFFSVFNATNLFIGSFIYLYIWQFRSSILDRLTCKLKFHTVNILLLLTYYMHRQTYIICLFKLSWHCWFDWWLFTFQFTLIYLWTDKICSSNWKIIIQITGRLKFLSKTFATSLKKKLIRQQNVLWFVVKLTM